MPAILADDLLDDLLDDPAVDIGQTEVAAGVPEGESLVVDTSNSLVRLSVVAWYG